MLKRVGRAATTDLLLATWLASCARKENTWDFKTNAPWLCTASQLALPNSSSPEEDSADGTTKRQCWRRRSCGKKPTARSRSREGSCIVRIWLQASLCRPDSLFTEGWSYSLLPDKICRRRKRCLQNPSRSPHGRRQKNTKYSNKHIEQRAGRSHTVQKAKQKKSPANPYLHPILPLAGYENLLWWWGRPHSKPCPPTPPNLQAWICWEHQT